MLSNTRADALHHPALRDTPQFLFRSSPAIICPSSSDVRHPDRFQRLNAFAHPLRVIGQLQQPLLLILRQTAVGAAIVVVQPQPDRQNKQHKQRQRNGEKKHAHVYLQGEPRRNAAAQSYLLVGLIHFGFQRRQLLADFIVRFQFGKLLIQRLLLAKAVALRFRFHLIDATLKGFKARHRLIQFTAIQLATHIAGRTRRLMAQRQRLLTGAGFAKFVLQLANLFSSAPVSSTSCTS